ncbi:MAG: hypothetical protein RL033_5718 [Pseudomonadota bacterium]|jgi:hypothetical protein
MASWEAVNASASEPLAAPPPLLVRSLGRGSWRRWLATVNVAQHALNQCFAARAGLWLARGAGVSFVLAGLYVSGLAPDASDGVLRMALLSLSWCAGLATLSAAGPAVDRLLEGGRGLLETRAVELTRLQGQRPLAVALWLLRRIGSIALLVVLACLAFSRAPHGIGSGLRLALGVALYVLLLAAGLALLAELCRIIGRGRGQVLFLAVALLPPLFAPAWPELPTLISGYGHLLDRSLGLEVRP